MLAHGFEVASAACDGATTVITVRHISKANRCPGCGASFERVHSRRPGVATCHWSAGSARHYRAPFPMQRHSTWAAHSPNASMTPSRRRGHTVRGKAAEAAAAGSRSRLARRRHACDAALPAAVSISGNNSGEAIRGAVCRVAWSPPGADRRRRIFASGHQVGGGLGKRKGKLGP